MPKNKHNVLVLKAELNLRSPLCQIRKTKGPVFRDIAILSGQSLYGLAKAIVEGFGFDFDHCFGFFSKIADYGFWDSEKKYELFTDLIEEGETIEPTGASNVKKTKTGEVWQNIGDRMLFLFDYGDNWMFIVELVEIQEKQPRLKYPSVVRKVGRAPRQY